MRARASWKAKGLWWLYFCTDLAVRSCAVSLALSLGPDRVIPHAHYPRRLQAGTVGDTAASYSLSLDMYGQRQEQADFHFFGEYYTELTLGSPGRIYRLQLDTGSAALVLPGPECTDCGTGLRRYDWHKSSKASPLAVPLPCAPAIVNRACAIPLSAQSERLTATAAPPVAATTRERASFRRQP